MFSKELTVFRKMVEERGAHLRRLPLEQLRKLANQPVEHTAVISRSATVEIIVLPLPEGGIQVIVQGFLQRRFLPGKSSVQDGFYKYPDETTAPLDPEKLSSAQDMADV